MLKRDQKLGYKERRCRFCSGVRVFQLRRHRYFGVTPKRVEEHVNDSCRCKYVHRTPKDGPQYHRPSPAMTDNLVGK